MAAGNVSDQLEFSFCSGPVVGSTVLTTVSPALYTISITTTDVDGCANPSFPCFESRDGVHRAVCVDDESTASSAGFTCLDCPTGYQGDGVDCVDVDGCTATPYPCFNASGATASCLDRVRCACSAVADTSLIEGRSLPLRRVSSVAPALLALRETA